MKITAIAKLRPIPFAFKDSLHAKRRKLCIDVVSVWKFVQHRAQNAALQASFNCHHVR